jgi:hypothetical protein
LPIFPPFTASAGPLRESTPWTLPSPVGLVNRSADKRLFLEERASATKGSINRGGHYRTDPSGLAAFVRDEKRFPEKWAYFSFAKDAQPARPNLRAACFECHNPHGAVDNTFVQFCPTLKPVAQKYGTYSQTQAATDR